MRRASLRTVALALVAVVAAQGCAASSAMRAAERGDRTALAADVAPLQRSGGLSERDAASLARAVAEHEIRSASPADAVERVRDLRSCAHELDGALARRMRIHDAAGAEAALARIEARSLDPADARGFIGDDDAHWRAVGARALVTAEDRDARLRALVDPSPLVRRDAARASSEAADPHDLLLLAQAARVDPEPLVRTEAVRAIAALARDARAKGEPRASAGFSVSLVDALRDLWTAGDDGLREDIAIAWSSPALWRAGGRDALRFVVAGREGAPAVEAAAAVLRHTDADADVAGLAAAELVRVIQGGSRAVRQQALAEAPMARGGLRAAIATAAADEDPLVRTSALARLVQAGDSHARGELESLASPGSSAASGARLALSEAGDRRIQAWVEGDLASSAPQVRIEAAVALAALGVAARAAPLLADTDARVRARVACTILMAGRRRAS